MFVVSKRRLHHRTSILTQWRTLTEWRVPVELSKRLQAKLQNLDGSMIHLLNLIFVILKTWTGVPKISNFLRWRKSKLTFLLVGFSKVISAAISMLPISCRNIHFYHHPLLNGAFKTWWLRLNKVFGTIFHLYWCAVVVVIVFAVVGVVLGGKRGVKMQCSVYFVHVLNFF